MSNTLEVFKGEAQESITITNIDSLGAAVDLSWATFASSSESIVEVKDKPGGTILTTLSTTDITSMTTTTMVIKGDKLYALPAGDSYFVKITARNTGGRVKVLSFYLEVFNV